MEEKTNYLVHHGILNQKWGVRNGPPYPLGGGDYSYSEAKAVKRARLKKNSIYNKKHFDEVLKANKSVLSTLSYDKDRTKNAEMFYATHKKLDKHQYNALFNKKAPRDVFDKDGNKIGTGQFLKYRIDNKLRTDVKVASEDSGAKMFIDLYNKDRDFSNFVNDKDRLKQYFDNSVHYKFKGYRQAEKTLDKITEGKNPSSKDLNEVYRLFNYTIPYDGAGNSRYARDMQTQRAKYFKVCKASGYGALLDTNDAIYGGFKATSPVIMFDMSAIIPTKVYQTKTIDKRFSQAVLVGRKALGV